MSGLPQGVKTDVQRILDRAARRLLAAELDRKADAGKPPRKQRQNTDRGDRRSAA